MDPVLPESIPTPTIELPDEPPEPVPDTEPAPSWQTMPWWEVAALLLGLAVMGGGLTWLFARRRWREPEEPVERDTHEVFELGPNLVEPSRLPPRPAPPPAAAPAPAASSPFITVPSPAPPRATLEIELRPKRAGTNVTSAAVDYEIAIRNAGQGAALGVRLDVRLLSAGGEQDGQIARLFATPIERPAVAPFDLPAGVSVELAGMAMLPREAVAVMAVDGRQLFVPVLTINLVYGWPGGGQGQAATSHVVGLDRGEGAKLAPFRLDAPPRMYDAVSAIPYTIMSRV